MIKQYLLTLLSAEQPRRIRVVENVLKNKRTVANLFWAKTYDLLPWLGADPHLSRADYEQSLHEWREQRLLKDDPVMLQLTPAGVKVKQNWLQNHYQPHFFDYYWVANPIRLARRTLLAIQTLSELAAHNTRYAPLAVDMEDLLAVKKWVVGLDRSVISTIGHQCLQFATALARIDPRLADLFSSQLVGHQISGIPAQQEARTLGVDTSELFLMNRDLWLAFGWWLLTKPGQLTTLMRPLLHPNALPASASQTLSAFKAGQTVETISARRHLKVSTIREHLLAAAILTPDQVDWDGLLPSKIRTTLAQTYSGPVRKWQFRGDHDPVAFFYYRLYQIFKERENDSNS